MSRAAAGQSARSETTPYLPSTFRSTVRVDLKLDAYAHRRARDNGGARMTCESPPSWAAEDRC